MFYDEPEGKVINLHDSKITRFFKRLGYLIIVIVIAIYFLTGIYVVGPDEVGMVRTLGKFSRQVPPSSLSSSLSFSNRSKTQSNRT